MSWKNSVALGGCANANVLRASPGSERSGDLDDLDDRDD
jgi:hypothetical protein